LLGAEADELAAAVPAPPSSLPVDTGVTILPPPPPDPVDAGVAVLEWVVVFGSFVEVLVDLVLVWVDVVLGSFVEVLVDLVLA